MSIQIRFSERGDKKQRAKWHTAHTHTTKKNKNIPIKCRDTIYLDDDKMDKYHQKGIYVRQRHEWRWKMECTKSPLSLDYKSLLQCVIIHFCVTYLWRDWELGILTKIPTYAYTFLTQLVSSSFYGINKIFLITANINVKNVGRHIKYVHTHARCSSF